MKERIAIIGKNSITYVSIILEIWNNKDCVVLIDSQIPIKVAVQMIEEAEVKRCFIQKELFDGGRYVENTDCNFIVYEDSNMSAKLLPEEIREKYCASFSKDEAVVIYSSGTTGKARGVILSHYAITTNADAIIKYMKPTNNDCIYIVRPLTHSSAVVGELLVSLRSGCNLLLAPVIVPPRYIFSNIQKFDVTTLCLSPNILGLLLSEKKGVDLPSLKRIYSSGSILSESKLSKTKKFFRGVNVFNVYGLTETGPRVSAQRFGCCNKNSVGRAIDWVEIVIVDENGKLLGCNEKGLIHVNTPCLYSGYIKGETKNRSYYKDWKNTGDIGYFDENGELYVVERSDDLVFIGSHKIYPSDVSLKIMDLCNIDDCVVVAVTVDSKDVLCCLYIASVDIDTETKKRLGLILMKHEMPKYFIRVKSFDKNTNGKMSIRNVKDTLIKMLEERKIHEFGK